ncbi:MAG: hypothetical protein M3220_01625 [Chloroflexota bacterium]|nr:hypothetical protein [Chloroflexota bacterium]
MDDSIRRDLLAAHADGLIAGEDDYRERYSALFPEEIRLLEPFFELAERLHALFQKPLVMRPDFRAELKADLLAQARQQQLQRKRDGWRWAAIGASVTVASVIAAAAWRGTHHRGAI